MSLGIYILWLFGRAISSLLFRSNQNEEAKKLLVFILVSAMQVAFLAKNIAKEILGYDLYSKTERDLFIFNTVTMLFQGTDNKEDDVNEM